MKPVKRFLGSLGGALVLGLVWLRLRLPEPGAERLARAAGGLLRILLPSRRRIALRNLRRAFGSDRTPAQRAALLARAYRFGPAMFSGLLRLFRQDRDGFLAGLAVEGREHLAAALAGGRGVVVVSGHHGAFPALGAALAHLGTRFSFIYRRPADRFTAGLFDRWLLRAGCGVIEDRPRHLSALKALRALARGEAVCVLIDQHFAAGIPVPFFGVPARTGVGAAFLAARAGAPLLPARLTVRPDGGYRLAFDPPVPPPAGDQVALAGCMAGLTRTVEGWIREDPEQWFWVHRRWKEADAAEAA